MTISYVSVCSGIESASVAWHSLGFTPLVFSEIEPFPAAVLAHRFPGVANLGDFTKIPGFMFRGVADLLVGGTPCQAFSVAGKRESLSDDRGNLTLEFCNLADEMGVPSVVWENVPGVLTTDDNAFGCFISKMCGHIEVATPTEPPTGDEINGKKIKGSKRDYWRWSKSADAFVPKWPTAGYIAGAKRCLAWRVLDAQYFGLAQRRRRVFVVASTAEGADPATVLFEPESLRRDSPPSREERQSIAAESGRCANGDDTGTVGSVLARTGLSVSAQDAAAGHIVSALDTECGYQSQAFQSVASGHVIGTITSRMFNALGARDAEEGALQVAYPIHDKATRHAGKTGKGSGNGLGVGRPTDPCPTLTSGDKHAVGTAGAVRKLTPIECERLQGFPDDWTKVPYRGKSAEDCPDGPRYKAIGNSKAVPAVRWLGQRIAEVLACKQ